MNKLLSRVFVVGVFAGSTAYAMPIAVPRPTQAGLTIQVGNGGCGLGVHRGPFDGCSPVDYGYYQPYRAGQSRAYRRGYYRGYRDGYNAGLYGDSAWYGGGGYEASLRGCAYGKYEECDWGICWHICY